MPNDTEILRTLGLMMAAEEGSHAKRLVWVCSWCRRERGELPKPNETDGICERHAAIMRAEIRSFHAKAA